MSCIDCEILKDQISNLELMLATADQENRQQHARNQRLTEELAYAEKLIGELREERVSMPYAKIKDSFTRTDR